MSERTVLKAESRQDTGKGVARRLRMAGRVPAVAYGGGMDPKPLSVDPDDVVELFDNPKGKNIVFNVELEDGQVMTDLMVKSYQIDPVRRELLHVDMFAVDMDREIVALVPVKAVGRAAGVKAGGILSTLRPDVHIKAKPGDIPAVIEADVTNLNPGQTIQAADLSLPEGVAPGYKANYGLLTIVMPRKKKALLAEAAKEA